MSTYICSNCNVTIAAHHDDPEPEIPSMCNDCIEDSNDNLAEYRRLLALHPA